MERSPIPLYLFFSRRSRPLERMRWRLVPEAWRQEPSFVRKIFKALFVFAWPTVAFIRSMKEVYKKGNDVAKIMDSSRVRIVFNLWLSSVWFGVSPKDYCQYADIIKNRISVRFFINNQERAYLVDACNKYSSREFLLDKMLFTQKCNYSKLPCIPIFFRFHKDKVDEMKNDIYNYDVYKSDLFSKFSGGSGGDGAHSWLNVDYNTYISKDKKIYTLDKIIDYLRYRSYSGEHHILQPRIYNHQAIENLSHGGLCSARVLTARRKKGDIVTILAVFKMPGGDSLTDNLSTGGIACNIDINSGILSSGKLWAYPLLKHATHPDTGAQIEDRKLPYWNEALQLCHRAHSLFDDYAFIGWDIAFTDQGALLIEGNDHPGMDLLQIGSGGPLGCTIFSEVAYELLQN